MIRRFVFLAVWLAFAALAGPPLTTVQDVLYKADGTRFSGTLTISWNSFQALGSFAIVTQTTTAKVVDGNLRVQLVPTTTSTPPATYNVVYRSDGRIQFQETWAVPSSNQPLRVRDVRTSVGPIVAGDTTGGTVTLPIQESDVMGLITDLGSRPLKGPGFAAGRVAMVNATGILETVNGNATDCVRVDGSSAPCGGDSGGGPTFVDGDSPTGIVDGANTAFGLSTEPVPPSSLSLYRNGMLQKIGFDFTLTGSAVQFVPNATPQPGDTLLASYRIGGTAAAAVYSTPTVLCSGPGISTSSQTMATVGTCTIPAGQLAPGDRVEIRYDFAHTSAAAGYSVEVQWGTTTVLHRDPAAADTLVAGRTDAVILTAGTQFSSQAWGTVLPFGAGVVSGNEPIDEGATLTFRGLVTDTNDSLSLTNFTVLRVR